MKRTRFERLASDLSCCTTFPCCVSISISAQITTCDSHLAYTIDSYGKPQNQQTSEFTMSPIVQEDRLKDSAGAKPSYNLRTLTRGLEYCRQALPLYGLKRALYDGLAMAFLTQLNPTTAPILEAALQKCILGSTRPKDLKVSCYFSTWAACLPVAGTHVQASVAEVTSGRCQSDKQVQEGSP